MWLAPDARIEKRLLDQVRPATISPEVVRKYPTPGRVAYTPYRFFIFAEDP